MPSQYFYESMRNWRPPKRPPPMNSNDFIKLIKACEYNHPCVDEVIRYAGGINRVLRIYGFVHLIQPEPQERYSPDSLIWPWIRMSKKKLKSFGIEGEVFVVLTWAKRPGQPIICRSRAYNI